MEPRWFEITEWGASDEHPPHDVVLGEYLIANVYEALRASPLWERTLLIVTFDEHGGFYDHVPTPLLNVPNPDGKDSTDPPFNFDRLGVRVPTIMVSPWIAAGTVINEPNENQVSAQPGSRWEHSSVSASLKEMFNLPDFLTNRDTWAASFASTIVNLSKPRTDCPTQLPIPGTTDQKRARKIEIEKPLTDELFEAVDRSGEGSAAPLTDLQYEILTIAKGLTNDQNDVHGLKTEHEGAKYCRQQLKKFFSSQ